MRMNSSRRGLTYGLISLITIVGCFDFSVDLTTANGTVPVTSQSGMTTFSSIVAVDLSQNSDYSKHKSNIDSLTLNSVTLTIPQGGINADNNTPAVTMGSVALRPDGATDASQDVQAASVGNLPITVGSTVKLTASPGLDTFLNNVVKGSGKFSIVLSGSVQAAVNNPTVVDFTLSVNADYTLTVNPL
jgi:hypothetical protein